LVDFILASAVTNQELFEVYKNRRNEAQYNNVAGMAQCFLDVVRRKKKKRKRKRKTKYKNTK